MGFDRPVALAAQHLMRNDAIKPTSLPGDSVYALAEVFEDLDKGCLMRLFHCTRNGPLSSL